MAVEAPDHLGTAGKALWNGIAGSYQLRADEIRVLEDAAAEADLIDDLRASFVGEPKLVKGSQGQLVIHPIVAELRQHRATLKALLGSLKLPDANPEAAAADRSTAARSAANARWSKRGA
jgi:hypothetical protein